MPGAIDRSPITSSCVTVSWPPTRMRTCFFGLLLSLVVAAAAMALSSVSVIANPLRLRAMRLSVN